MQKPIYDLAARECRWPVGEDSDGVALFCAEETAGVRAYCRHHFTLAYKPPPARGRPRGRFTDPVKRSVFLSRMESV